jgi:hypothetical protein
MSVLRLMFLLILATTAVAAPRAQLVQIPAPRAHLVRLPDPPRAQLVRLPTPTPVPTPEYPVVVTDEDYGKIAVGTTYSRDGHLYVKQYHPPPTPFPNYALPSTPFYGNVAPTIDRSSEHQNPFAALGAFVLVGVIICTLVGILRIGYVNRSERPAYPLLKDANMNTRPLTVIPDNAIQRAKIPRGRTPPTTRT